MFSLHRRLGCVSHNTVALAFTFVWFALITVPANAQRPRTLDFNGANQQEDVPGLIDPFEDDQSDDASSVLDDLPPFEDSQGMGTNPTEAPYDSESAFGNQNDPLQAQQTSNQQQPNFDTSGFQANLARAPYMLGDFFGQGGAQAQVQLPSRVVAYNDFTSAVRYLSPASEDGVATFSDLSGSAFFDTNGVFISNDANNLLTPGVDVGLTSVDSLTVINGPPEQTTFNLVITDDGGMTIGTTDLQTLQTAFLNGATNDPQQDLAAQRAALGDGTFHKVDVDSIAVGTPTATLNPIASSGGPFSPNGGPALTTVGGPSTQAVAGVDRYFLQLPYTATFSNDIFTPAPFNLFLPSPSAGAVVGRVRLQDNNSAIPQDRVFFDYNHFHNVPLAANGIDVNRFTPGIERTFWRGRSSVEVRVPMAMTLNSNYTTDGAVDTSNFEVGNVTVSQKFLLASNQNMAVACGLGVAAPTADDFNVGMVDGTELIRVENQAFHALPYLAVLYSPQYSSFYAHLFATLDFDVNGNPVYANVNGVGLNEIGTFRDQHLFAMSASMGKWIYRNNHPCSRLNAIALTSELHFTQTLNDADSIRGGNFVIGDPNAELSLLNGTIGTHVQMGLTTLTAGYTLPITSDDRVFDGEFRLFINRKY